MLVLWHGFGSRKFAKLKVHTSNKTKNELYERIKGVHRQRKTTMNNARTQTRQKKITKSFTRKSLQPTIETAIKHAMVGEKRVCISRLPRIYNEDHNNLPTTRNKKNTLRCSARMMVYFYWRFYASHHPFSTLINQSHQITSWAIHRFTSFAFCSAFSIIRSS